MMGTYKAQGCTGTIAAEKVMFAKKPKSALILIMDGEQTYSKDTAKNKICNKLRIACSVKGFVVGPIVKANTGSTTPNRTKENDVSLLLEMVE